MSSSEFDTTIRGISAGRVRLESGRSVAPRFSWVTVHVDCVARLADDVGLTVIDMHLIGFRVIATLAAR
jgi:hypothetical protein